LSSKLKFVKKDCLPEFAQDRSLPYTSYLVEYLVDGTVHYDVVICNKKVDIFDYYWDNYREGLIRFTQTEGRVNPKLWDHPDKKKNKK
jgi:hypothetical protein